MTEVDWNAGHDGTGEERGAALRVALRLTAPHLDAFISQLNVEMSSKDWGFARLAEIRDEGQRGLVSDQFLSAAYGLRDALVDTAIAAKELRDATGPNGLPYPDRGDSLNEMLQHEQIRRSVAAFFDATGTALDCLAAVLVVVSRAPLSIQRADFRALLALDPTGNYAKAFVDAVPNEQRELWISLLKELTEARSAGPPDWLDWSLEMRNALTHRGRVTNIFLPRRISRELALPRTSKPQALFRYDLHLRRRPWLPEIEAMLVADGLPETWLDEPATRTLEGLLDALSAYCDQLMAWASATWLSPPALTAPVLRWVLPAEPTIEFTGVEPGGTVEIQGAIGGVNLEHVRLAERLRIRQAAASKLAQPEG
jgi:hypothetical protein